jgi:CHAD domain-containing protein
VPETGTNPSNIEVEWQLDALDLRPVERWLAAGPRVVPGPAGASTVVVTTVERPVKRLVDIYLDTADWRIGRSGFVLRVRHHADQAEVTLKGTAAGVDGLRKRIEVTEPLPSAGVHAMGGSGPVGRRLRALAGSAGLVHLLEVRTRRRPYQLFCDEVPAGEIALDDTIIVVGDDQYPVRLRRVEVEVDPTWIDLLAPLVEQLRVGCGLQPAILSKFEAGLLAAGLQIPALPDLGPTVLEPNPSLGDLAYAALRRNVRAMLAHEPGSRLGEDADELHDMRVATRRLRAGLDLFGPALPGHARHLRDELGWIARELGDVRDLDVQLERLDEWRGELPEQDSGALDDLSGLLDRQRAVARDNLLDALDSDRYDELVADLVDLLRPGPGTGGGRRSTEARVPAVVAAPALIFARHRAATRAARRARRSGDPADFHRLRILCKRLRYALEFVSEIYDGQTRGVVRRVVALQDCLGLMQDAGVAAGRLHALATTEGSGLSPATVFAMGELAERYRREAQEKRLVLPKLLGSLKGAKWRGLKALMEERRHEAGSPEGWSAGTRVVPPATPADVSRGDVATTDPTPTGLSSTGLSSTGPSFPTGARPGRIRPADEHDSGATDAGPGTTPPGGAHEPTTSPGDDADWDEEYTPALRSVPPVPTAPAGEPPPADTPAPSPHFVESPAPRRRKDPVFLPAPPRPASTGPGVPGVPPGGGRGTPTHEDTPRDGPT